MLYIFETLAVRMAVRSDGHERSKSFDKITVVEEERLMLDESKITPPTVILTPAPCLEYSDVEVLSDKNRMSSVQMPQVTGLNPMLQHNGMNMNLGWGGVNVAQLTRMQCYEEVRLETNSIRNQINMAHHQLPGQDTVYILYNTVISSYLFLTKYNRRI